MKIISVVPRGYCKGVYRAIKIAKETAIKYPNENNFEYILLISLYGGEVTISGCDIICY